MIDFEKISGHWCDDFINHRPYIRYYLLPTGAASWEKVMTLNRRRGILTINIRRMAEIIPDLARRLMQGENWQDE